MTNSKILVRYVFLILSAVCIFALVGPGLKTLALVESHSVAVVNTFYGEDEETTTAPEDGETTAQEDEETTLSGTEGSTQEQTTEESTTEEETTDSGGGDVQTGDDSNIILWFALMAASLLTLIVTLVRYRIGRRVK